MHGPPVTAFRFEQLGEAPTALVAAVQLPGVTAAQLESSLGELERLASTLGMLVVGRVVQRRGKLASGEVFGDGKLVEIAAWTGGDGQVEAYVRPGSRQAREAAAAELDAEASAEFNDDLDAEPDDDDASADGAESGDGPDDDQACFHDLARCQQERAGAGAGAPACQER